MKNLKVFSGGPIYKGKQVTVYVATTSRLALVAILAKHGIRETVGHVGTHWSTHANERITELTKARPGVVFIEVGNYSGNLVELKEG